MKYILALGMAAVGLAGWSNPGLFALAPLDGSGVGVLDGATFIFESNATDMDGEVVLNIKTDAALDRVVVRDPHGAVVLGAGSLDDTQLGVSQLRMESAEPSIDLVKAAYPEGRYDITARTTDGRFLRTTAILSHELLAVPNITNPHDGDTGVPLNGVVVTWELDPGAERYILEIEQEALEMALTLEIPGTIDSFAIPDGYFVSGQEIQMGLAAVDSGGNVIVSEIFFHTL